MTATITSSSIASTVQVDGRSAVVENYIDSLGGKWSALKLVNAGADLNAMLAADGVALLANLQSGEIQLNVNQVTSLGSLGATTFRYSTQAQNLAALRTVYQSATQIQAVMIGDFLSSLTDVQLENIFSMTLAQVTSLRTNKLTPAANTATAVRASVGQ